MTTGIHSLPKELLLRVFGFIAQEDEEYSRIWIQRILETTARVSKLFNVISTKLLYQAIEIDDEDSLILLAETLLLHNPERCNLVERFEAFGFDDGQAAPLICKRILACKFPAMRNLDLDARFTESLTVMPFVPCLARLKCLKISGLHLPMFDGYTFPELQKLSLRDFTQASPRFHPSFPSLQKLSLHNVEASASVCDWLKAAITSLRVLRVRAGYMYNERGRIDLFGALPSDTEELIFVGSRDRDVSALAPYLARYTRLRKLHVSSSSATGLLEVVPPTVEVLEISFTKVKVDGLAQMFTRLQCSDTLPSVKTLLMEVCHFRTPPSEELKEACDKTYESLASRGIKLSSPDSNRWDVWDTKAALWTQHNPAPQHPLAAMFAGGQNPFAGMFGQGNQNALAEMFGQDGFGDD